LQPTQTNADTLSESLSALMDDAAQPLELQRVLKASQNDEQVRQQWARYQLASAALKRQASDTHLHLNIADNVRLSIAEEASHNTAQETQQPSLRTRLNQFWQPVAGLAVAASVTMVMVLGAQRIGVAVQPDVAPVQEGVVLLEPGASNSAIQLASTNPAKAATSADHAAQIIRVPTPATATNAGDAQWQAQYLPNGFVLTERGLDESDQVAREVLTYGDGTASFTLYVEALNGRTIAEGHAYAGSNLVLGQSMDSNGNDVFVTLVGQLTLAQAEQVANSVVSLTAH